jgi:hypothetical protein
MKTLTHFSKLRTVKINFIFPEINNMFLSGLIIMTLFLFSSQSMSAQNIKEYNTLINSMNNTRQSGSIEPEILKSLVFDLKPKIYINNKEENTYGNGSPECVNIDAKSIELLYENNQLFSNVEMITINLNSSDELNFVLDLSKLQSFTNLKYIQFLCSFSCDSVFLSKLNQVTSKTGIIVFYRISIPE